MHLLLVLPTGTDPGVERELVTALHHGGHLVDRAHGDEEALWLATGSGFDALVIDREGAVDAPAVPALCSALRGADVWTPILLLTPVSDEQCIAALDAGADDYATEPFTESELDARLRALVRRGQPARPQQPDRPEHAGRKRQNPFLPRRQLLQAGWYSYCQQILPYRSPAEPGPPGEQLAENGIELEHFKNHP